MVTEPTSPAEEEALPFVAPCRELSPAAPWRWFKMGLQDIRRAPWQSLTYGFVMAVLIFGVSLLSWFYGRAWLMLSALCGFVFLAPLSCIGIYAISAQIERNQPVSMIRTLRAAFKRYLGSELVFALVLMVIFLLWARAGSVISIFFPDEANADVVSLLTYWMVFIAVGAVFAGLTFAASVFALPMIMHRDVDTITAVLTSVNAVLRNKRAMLVWIALIVLALLLGMATAFLGLIVLLPAIGHAVWHGYLETIDASQFPRHEVGITAVARTPDP
ncbi:MAG: DUF2189 domain-containing protein [Gammaproteobacteria bacterium]|nr:DUF2189 domain-containing protein [Gammaproteobacteria bacterium]